MLKIKKSFLNYKVISLEQIANNLFLTSISSILSQKINLMGRKFLYQLGKSIE